MREIKFKKRSEFAKTPTKAHDIDGGFDFYCTWFITTENYIEYHTDISIEIPEGMVGFLFPRSSVTNKNLMLKNSVGVIDASYRGEIVARFHNTLELINDEGIYHYGDRVCQIVFMDLPEIKLVESDDLTETNRNENGFGSSGR